MLQAGGRVPEVLLGPRIHELMSHIFLNFDFTASLLPRVLELCAVRHALEQPAAVLVPHLVKWSEADLRAKLMALPEPAFSHLAAQCAGCAAGTEGTRTKRR